jgi:hypothetical protein
MRKTPEDLARISNWILRFEDEHPLIYNAAILGFVALVALLAWAGGCMTGAPK